MKHLKQILILLTGGLMVLNTLPRMHRIVRSMSSILARSVPDVWSPRRRWFWRRGGSRTNYVYLPGQTLAPEAIYFDHRADVTNLTDAYLKHFDAVVQVMPDAEVGAGPAEDARQFQERGQRADQVHRRPASGGCGSARSCARVPSARRPSRLGKLCSPRVLRCSVCRARCRITSAARSR